MLGILPVALFVDVMPSPCGIGAAGARLGSPPTPGVADLLRPATIDDAVDSPLESGSVGCLREAFE